MKYSLPTYCLTQLPLYFVTQEHLESRRCCVQESWTSWGLITGMLKDWASQAGMENPNLI